jgi:hypothetical protein
MIILSKDQIKEIVDELDSGKRCYINKETGEIKTILNFWGWPTIKGSPGKRSE